MIHNLINPRSSASFWSIYDFYDTRVSYFLYFTKIQHLKLQIKFQTPHLLNTWQAILYLLRTLRSGSKWDSFRTLNSCGLPTFCVVSGVEYIGCPVMHFHPGSSYIWSHEQLIHQWNNVFLTTASSWPRLVIRKPLFLASRLQRLEDKSLCCRIYHYRYSS